MSCLNSLVIKVERVICNPRQPFHKVFEIQVNVDSSISVPYEQISNTLRFLYGNDKIVSISSQLLNLNH